MKSGGGVGGTSPVIFTNASMPAQSSFKATTGPIVKTSMLLGEVDLPSMGDVFKLSPASSEGFGRGGNVYVKVSSLSWTSCLIGETIAVPVEERVADMVLVPIRSLSKFKISICDRRNMRYGIYSDGVLGEQTVEVL